MADNVEGEQSAPPGNGQGSDWEVVTLTASAYAAAPGPVGIESFHEEKGETAAGGNEVETSDALIMSRHFVFPPSKHENLPSEADKVEFQKKDKEAESGAAELWKEEGGRSGQKSNENWNIGGLNVPEEFSSIYDEKGNKLSIHGSEFEEATALHGLKVDDMQRDMYSSGKFSSFNTGANLDEEDIYDAPDSLELNPEPSDKSQSESDETTDKNDGHNLPPGAWWKRKVVCLCSHATETNAIWSVFIAAAVMGLVILGHRWQQERRQVLQDRWQLCLHAEKSGKIVGPLSRFKNIIVAGNQQASYMKNGAAAEL